MKKGIVISNKTVAFIVNGGRDSAMGFRARDFAARISKYDIHIAYRTDSKIRSILSFFNFLVRLRPTATYVFDVSYSGILSAGFYRLVFGNCLIVETGDAITELVRSSGSRGIPGVWLTQFLENTAFWIADRVVVRGTFHQELLARQGIGADVIQDGVDTGKFALADAGKLRKEHGLEGVLTIGLLGSSIWSEKLQMCYGWELVETIGLLADSGGEGNMVRGIKGIMIGGGSGILRLKARCRELGIEDRIIFLDFIPYEQLPRYLSLINVCLSTQTNDLVGQVRTTGKLPLYLAAGRYILASDVGEAARVLEPEMLVPYDDVKDEQYPQKLAERIRTILSHPEILDQAEANIALAKKHFDYSVLAERANRVIEAAIKARGEQR
ncbi:MAG: glycosyltransferase [Pyrinomonadaceae bacterium]|nr:glycosyltransferase [Pyrinomonadaceae bacterium]